MLFTRKLIQIQQYRQANYKGQKMIYCACINFKKKQEWSCKYQIKQITHQKITRDKETNISKNVEEQNDTVNRI